MVTKASGAYVERVSSTFPKAKEGKKPVLVSCPGDGVTYINYDYDKLR